MVGTILAVVTFLTLYAVILILRQGDSSLDPFLLAVALIIPFAISTIIGFGSGVLGSAALAGWLSALAMIVITGLTLWLIGGLPVKNSIAYSAAGTGFNVVMQSIWFYWLNKRG